jgi:ketosteroid isomerase-like protein
MSQENVEVVGRVLEFAQEGLRRGGHHSAFDRAVAAGVLAPDLEWRGGARGGVGVAGLRDATGREGYVEFMRTWTEDFEDFEMEPEEIVDAGVDRVVVVTRQRARGKGSGAPVDMRAGIVCRFESNRVARVDLFVDPAKALEAAGLWD